MGLSVRKGPTERVRGLFFMLKLDLLSESRDFRHWYDDLFWLQVIRALNYLKTDMKIIHRGEHMKGHNMRQNFVASLRKSCHVTSMYWYNRSRQHVPRKNMVAWLIMPIHYFKQQ